MGYVRSRFLIECYSTLEGYVEDNKDSLERELRNVGNVGEVSFTNMNVKSVWVNDLPGVKLEFDVVVEGEIEITEGNYHSDG